MQGCRPLHMPPGSQPGGSVCQAIQASVGIWKPASGIVRLSARPTPTPAAASTPCQPGPDRPRADVRAAACRPRFAARIRRVRSTASARSRNSPVGCSGQAEPVWIRTTPSRGPNTGGGVGDFETGGSAAECEIGSSNCGRRILRCQRIGKRPNNAAGDPPQTLVTILFRQRGNRLLACGFGFIAMLVQDASDADRLAGVQLFIEPPLLVRLPAPARQQATARQSTRWAWSFFSLEQLRRFCTGLGQQLLPNVIERLCRARHHQDRTRWNAQD